MTMLDPAVQLALYAPPRSSLKFGPGCRPISPCIFGHVDPALGCRWLLLFRCGGYFEQLSRLDIALWPSADRQFAVVIVPVLSNTRR
jgi:hypothetical protein